MDIKTITLDGQVLFCPTKKQWEQLFKNPYIESKEIALIDFMKSRIEMSFLYPEVNYFLAEYTPKNKFHFYSLLKINNEFIRVHFENVICENCNKRAYISATPSTKDSYILLSPEEKTKAKEKALKYPNLICKHCGEQYHRRYTIWQTYELKNLL